MRLVTPSWAAGHSLIAGLTTTDESWPQLASMRSTDAELPNRQRLLRELGLDSDLFCAEQIHSSTVVNADSDRPFTTGDAVIANQSTAPIGVIVADCPAILVYDPQTKSRAAIHSGWRGTVGNIVANTVERLVDEFGVSPSTLLAWISPAAQASSYEVRQDVAKLFADKYLTPKDSEHWLLDVPLAVEDQLIAAGLDPDNIERSSLDTVTDSRLHSARRDGDGSGRMLALTSS